MVASRDRRICLAAAAMLFAGSGMVTAQDAAPANDPFGLATPSVEELARPKDETPEKADDAGTREAVCLMIEAAARANNLPLEFFARVIWQESRFQSNAVGPMTRSGQRAQGIAQFMPGTANERRLLDPFDPVQALRSRPNSSPSCAASSAISVSRRRPTTPVHGGCRNGLTARADAGGDAPLRCGHYRRHRSRNGRRRRAAGRSRIGPSRARAAVS